MKELTAYLQVWTKKLTFTNGELTQLLVILGAFLIPYLFVKFFSPKINPGFRKKLEKKSQSIFDVHHETLLTVTIFLVLLWSIDMSFWHFALDRSYFEPTLLIVLAWLGIRSITYLIDPSLLSRFVANVLWLTAALFISGTLVDFSKALKSYSYTVGKIDFSLHTFIIGVVIFSVLFWVSSLTALFIRRLIKINPKLNETQRVLIMKIVRICLYTLVFVVGFQIIGVDLTTITIFGGAIGFGIGFGLQKVFSNLISGIILLLDKSIRPNDVIAVAGTYGRVTKLDARYVSVITRDGKKHLIPNESLISERVENWSYSDNHVRLHIPVGVSYESDLDQVRDLMLEATQEASPRILQNPPPVCLLMGFGDSSVDFELRLWISDPQNGCEQPQSEVLFKIWEKFKEHDIKIPYPQRDIHVISQKKTLFG